MSSRSQPATSAFPPASSSGSSGGSHHKANVLASVQDAYWSDDEAEDNECPLCLEEMDLSDMNFKPCPCGYQICRFCWHHIRTNLNGRCPACRREYTEDSVEFKPVGAEDQKRLAQKKRQKEKERKDLDAVGRRQYTNIRIVQRNMIYVTGIGPRLAKEELLPTLRSPEYFGQYGKITKILLVKRPPPSTSQSRDPVIGLYINYYRREDAARAVVAVDGAPSPSGGGDVMRASYGTTKYCVNFLRGMPCGNQGCLDLHDWANESDCFTKEDLTTLKHTMKDTETRGRSGPGQNSRKSEDSDRKPASARNNSPRSDGRAAEAPALPKSASWARAGQTARPSSPLPLPGPPPGLQSSQGRPRQAGTRRDAPQAVQAARTSSTQDVPRSKPSISSTEARKAVPPLSRIATDASVDRSVPNDLPVAKAAAPQPAAAPAPPHQPAKSVAPVQPAKAAALPSPPAKAAPTPAAASGLEPKASAPGIVASTSSYRLTNSAKALLDDVLALRENPQVSPQSPFPDFDRTLMNLQGGGFSFNLDINTSSEAGSSGRRDKESVDWSTPSSPLSKFGVTPISIPAASELGRLSTPIYSGPFNPFDPPKEDRYGSQVPSIPSTRAQSPVEGEEVRKSSRFDFARRFGTPGSGHRTALSLSSSPMISDGMLMAGSPAGSYSMLSPVHPQQNLVQNSNSSNWAYSEYSQTSTQTGWGSSDRDASQGFSPQSESYAQPQQNLSSALLQKMLNIGSGTASQPPLQQRDDSMHPTQAYDSQSFGDPAIMSMQTNSTVDSYVTGDAAHGRNAGVPLTSGPPPGLVGPVSQFVNEQGVPYGGSPRSFRLPVGSSASSSRGGAGSPSYTSAMSISADSGDAEAASVSHEGELIDVDEIGDSRPISVDTGISSPIPQFRSPTSIELPITNTNDALVGDAPYDVDALPLSDADFPALPTSQPMVAPVRRETRRPTIVSTTSRSEPKVASNQKKPMALKMTAMPGSKSSSQATPSIPQDSAPPPGAARPPAGVKAASTSDIKPKVAASSSSTLPSKRPTQPLPISRSPVPPTIPVPMEPAEHAPILSRKARKFKPPPPPKVEKKPSRPFAVNTGDESEAVEASGTPHALPNVAFGASSVSGTAAESGGLHSSALALDADMTPSAKSVPATSPIVHTPTSAVHDTAATPSPVNGVGLVDDSRVPFLQNLTGVPASLAKMLDEIGRYLDVESSSFFDSGVGGGRGQSSIRYAPLVHALSTLSAGSGTFSSALPNTSIDSAVASFQQLLETLTQTISDILHLLPRNTWDDSSSFDGVLRDMLKAEDLLDEMSDTPDAKEDEVASLTMALEKRARWMEHQLSKLEDLHCDINAAAVRAVLSINDRGWDRTGFLPRRGGSLARFDALGQAEITGHGRPTSIQMLEAGLAEAKTKEAAAEAELNQAVHRSSAHMWSA